MPFVLGIAKVIYILTCLLIIGSVLLQESKGGGLAGLGGTRAESAFGASNPLRRLTVVLSVVFFVLASLLTLIGRPRTVGDAGAAPAMEAPAEPEKPASPSEGGDEPKAGEEKVEEKAPEKDGGAGDEGEGNAGGETKEDSPESGGNP